MLGVATLVVAVIAICFYAVLSSQARSRSESRDRFADKARIASEMTSSIFSISAPSTQKEASKTFEGSVIDTGELAKLVKAGNLHYAAILDKDGKVLAVSPRTPPVIRDRLGRRAKHIREALDGTPVLSDAIRDPQGNYSAVEWAIPFDTPSGRRIQLSAFDIKFLHAFMKSYLASAHGNSRGEGFVLDSQNRVISATGAKPAIGEVPPSAGLRAALTRRGNGLFEERGQQYVTAAPISGTNWKVALVVPTGEIYSVLAGRRAWITYLVLAALLLGGIASLLFLWRAVFNGAKFAAANAELSNLNATLEQRVAERTAEAEDRATELIRSNAELEQFASVASHDLQEPLRKIQMFGDRLHTRIADTVDEESATDLQRVQNAAQRMQHLINDLLAFSRVTSRGREFESVDLAKVTSEVLEDLEARVIELDARVDVGDLPVVDADRTQMRQLLQNLIGNALKFHRENEPPVIRIGSEIVPGREPRFAGEAASDKRCVITIEDNGIGFDEKYAERVFTAFQRLHGRSAYAGTGIGLSIARKIVLRHGGDIVAKGTPDQGATFIVTLPVSQPNGSNNGQGDQI
jgi:signal transduction histidine kinase